jgi:hypothetical protein
MEERSNLVAQMPSNCGGSFVELYYEEGMSVKRLREELSYLYEMGSTKLYIAYVKNATALIKDFPSIATRIYGNLVWITVPSKVKTKPTEEW